MRIPLHAMAAVLAMLALAGCAAEPGTDPGNPSAAPEPAIERVAQASAGDAARPRLALELLDGTRFDLAEQRGDWVVVNFWATWCAPCLKEIPDLSSLHAARDDLMVVGLAYEDIDPPAMREFLQQVPAAYPIAILDPYSDTPAGDFDTPRGLPMTYLIAPDGGIARRFLGPVTSAEIIQAIEEHAAG